MALVALTSAKGSPGVTTTALALALGWPRRAVAAECDPAGGDVMAGYFRGSVAEVPGLLGAITALRHDHPAAPSLNGFRPNLVALDVERTRLVLPGVTGPAQAAGLSSHWGVLAEALAGLHLDGNAAGVPNDDMVDVVADCGRLGAAYAPVPLLRRADVVALVVRSSLRSVRAAHAWAAKLGDDLAAHGRGGHRLGVLLVGEGRPYRCREIAAHLGLPSWGVVALDPKAASVLSDGDGSGYRLPRSTLLRTARSVATGLHRRLVQNAHGQDVPGGVKDAAACGRLAPRQLQQGPRTGGSETVTRHG